MNTGSKVITQLFFVIGALALAVVISIGMVTDAQGGLAALTPVLALSMAVLALLKPYKGIYFLIPLVIWVDEYKRLAVYYGGAYSMTVMQVLLMPFVVLAALNLGYFINVMMGRVKIDKVIFILYLIAGIVGCAVFLSMESGFATKGQRAANIAGYITLIPIVYTYLKSFDQWRKFFAMQVLFAFPAALWAIKQFYFGFDLIEVTYAMSGLSLAHYTQMLMVNPRVFGFFGSASALGCVAIYCSFAYWHAFRYSKRRILWIIIALLLTFVLVVSTQRAALLYPLFVLYATFMFRTKFRVLFTYGAAFGLFVLGIFSARYMLDEGLENINNVIATESEWGRNVLVVSTFSDRLRGWERLGRANSWSLFGTGRQEVGGGARVLVDVGGEDYNHDIINKILINYGVVGLLVVAALGGAVLYNLHKVPFDAYNKRERDDAAFALALALPMVGMSFIGGDNFNTNPINLQIWTSFSAVMVCRAVFQKNRAESKAMQRKQEIDSELRAAMPGSVTDYPGATSTT